MRPCFPLRERVAVTFDACALATLKVYKDNVFSGRSHTVVRASGARASGAAIEQVRTWPAKSVRAMDRADARAPWSPVWAASSRRSDKIGAKRKRALLSSAPSTHCRDYWGMCHGHLGPQPSWHIESASSTVVYDVVVLVALHLAHVVGDTTSASGLCTLHSSLPRYCFHSEAIPALSGYH